MTVTRVGIPQQIEGVTRQLGDKVSVLDSKVVVHTHAPHILTGAGAPSDSTTAVVGTLWADSVSGNLWSYTTTGWKALSTVAVESITSMTLVRQSL